jgi:MSHA pilin protein MshA
MNKNFKVQAQGGFTLIELIVVIVILGILAATALPKFANLSGDARLASLNAAKGAMSSASAIVHGKILVNPGAVNTTATPNTLAVEGVNVAVDNGYPAATGIMAAAGLSTDDYVSYTVGSGDKRPTVTGSSIALVPRSIDGTSSATTCFLTYTPATSATTPPVIALTANAANCE